MNIGIIALSLFVLTSVVYVDARNVFRSEDDGEEMTGMSTKDISVSDEGSAVEDAVISSSYKLPKNVICESCLKVSREVEKFLTNPVLPDKVDVYVNDACRILPPDLEGKCDEMLKSYMNQAILFLQTYFSEEKLCNSSGLCHEDPISLSSSSRNEHLSVTTLLNNVMSEGGENSLTNLHLHFPKLESLTNEMSDGSNCATCHAVMDDLSKTLENPETKIKIMRILLNACKNAGNDHINECKRMVLEYGPLVLSKLEWYLRNNDLCYMVHVCEAPKFVTLETVAEF